MSGESSTGVGRYDIIRQQLYGGTKGPVRGRGQEVLEGLLSPFDTCKEGPLGDLVKYLAKIGWA